MTRREFDGFPKNVKTRLDEHDELRDEADAGRKGLRETVRRIEEPVVDWEDFEAMTDRVLTLPPPEHDEN